MGEFAEFWLFSCICSHSSILWDDKIKLSIGEVFSLLIKLNKFFPSISHPPNRQPIPIIVLLCPSTWDFLPWNTPDSETWTFYRISPWPTMSAGQVPHAFTLHLYSPGLLLLLYFFIADTFWLFWLLCTRNLGLSLGQNI